jgi:hypothetical protein
MQWKPAPWRRENTEYRPRRRHEGWSIERSLRVRGDAPAASDSVGMKFDLLSGILHQLTTMAPFLAKVEARGCLVETEILDLWFRTFAATNDAARIGALVCG